MYIKIFCFLIFCLFLIIYLTRKFLVIIIVQYLNQKINHSQQFSVYLFYANDLSTKYKLNNNKIYRKQNKQK